MVFDNIFDPLKKTPNTHPMSNPQYSNDIINNQGKQYRKYQDKRRAKALRKNKELVEGFVESMTAKEIAQLLPWDNNGTNIIDGTNGTNRTNRTNRINEKMQLV